MTDYRVQHTDKNIDPIHVKESEVNSVYSVEFIGRIKSEYGETLNQNLLNLLENFASPEVSNNTTFKESIPDLNSNSNIQLQNPVEGQFWYNTTRNMIYYWNGDLWHPIPLRENYAMNWGSVIDGQQLPRPVSPLTGYTFEYSECIWSISPAGFVSKPGSITCATDNNAVVTMRYKMPGSGHIQPGLVNYLIIGIRGNYDTGQRHIPE